jgi:hypothetical protein
MFDKSKEFRIRWRAAILQAWLFEVMPDRQRQLLSTHGTELLKATPRVKSVWRMALALLVVSSVIIYVNGGYAVSRQPAQP